MEKIIVSTEKAPKAIGPYSQAVACGGFLFISGQIGMRPENGELVSSEVGAQCTQALENLQAVLNAMGLGFEHIVKTTIFLKDMEDFAEVNKIYATHFNDAPPARATLEVSRLPKNAKFEIEAIAAIPQGKSE